MKQGDPLAWHLKWLMLSLGLLIWACNHNWWSNRKKICCFETLVPSPFSTFIFTPFHFWLLIPGLFSSSRDILALSYPPVPALSALTFSLQLSQSPQLSLALRMYLHGGSRTSHRGLVVINWKLQPEKSCVDENAWKP